MSDVLRQCNGSSPWLRPIRPIALTLCDAVGLSRDSRFCALALVLCAAGLLLLVHLTVGHVEGLTRDAIYLVIRHYVSQYVTKSGTDWFYTVLLHWALSNGAFALFRIAAYLVLRAFYDLGRDVVFALLALIVAALSLALIAQHYAAGSAPAALPIERVGGAIFVLTTVLVWFWSRYISPHNAHRKVFDHDIGAALVRLRRN